MKKIRWLFSWLAITMALVIVALFVPLATVVIQANPLIISNTSSAADQPVMTAEQVAGRDLLASLTAPTAQSNQSMVNKEAAILAHLVPASAAGLNKTAQLACSSAIVPRWAADDVLSLSPTSAKAAGAGHPLQI